MFEIIRIFISRLYLQLIGPQFNIEVLLPLFFVNAVMAYHQSELAGAMHGNRKFWFWFILLIPIASHYCWWYEWYFSQTDQKYRSRLKNFFDLVSRALYLDELEDRKTRKAHCVTPFADPLKDKIRATASRPVGILDEWCDAEIDGLIENRQLSIAYIRALEKARDCRRKGDLRSVMIYRGYMDLLTPFVDTSQFKKSAEYTDIPAAVGTGAGNIV